MMTSISTLPRRNFLAQAAGAGLAAVAVSGTTQEAPAAETQLRPGRKLPERFPVKVIASDNGLEATKKAYELLLQGTDTLDACIAGVTIVEDDPNDMTVGYGGLPNEEGVVELDAAVMHGPTHKCGAVASLRNIKNPSRVARLVMQQTDHVLLVGEGALKFAKKHGFPEENLLTEKARKIWLYWQQSRDKDDDWFPPDDKDLDPDVRKYFKRPTGTIHCAAMNPRGDVSCCTTTSGLAFKIAGRVGDSPIIGAGLYVDNDHGSCGSTGRGEANLQNLSSFLGVELMRTGMAPVDAGLEVLRRIVHHNEPRLRDKDGRPNFDIKFYLLAKDGRHAGVSLFSPAKFAITDEQGTRHEDCAVLFPKK